MFAGCGEPAGTYSCDERTASASQLYGQEYTGLNSAALVTEYQSSCTGTWLAAGCSHSASLSACQAPPAMAITVTNWYYPGAANGYRTSADVMTACQGGGYIAP